MKAGKNDIAMKSKIAFIPSLAALLLAAACSHEAASPPEEAWVYDPTPYAFQPPPFFPQLDIPPDNPMTVQGVQLGRMLYYDPVLHPDGALACASCHLQEISFTSGPAVLPHINLGWNTAFLWDGRVQGMLEDIMLFEVKDFFKTDLARLEAQPDYPRLFYEAFGEKGITYERAARALAQFQRILVSGNSKYDRALRQEPGLFLTDAEVNGYELFFQRKRRLFPLPWRHPVYRQ